MASLASKTARWSRFRRPGPPSAPQPVLFVLIPSMAALIGKSFCDMSAVAFVKTILLVFVGSVSGAAQAVNSVRTKLPFFARPGPYIGKLGSRNTSRRNPVILVALVLTLTV